MSRVQRHAPTFKSQGLTLGAAVAYLLGALFVLDRILKLAAVVHFFARRKPTEPPIWPTVTLIQPITRGVSRLHDNLRARLRLEYPAQVQHLFVCDKTDFESQAICRELLASAPGIDASILLVKGQTGGTVASKVEKLRAALPNARGKILCFVDDDIGLRPNALRLLNLYLGQPQVGAVFGLACYTSWNTVGASLMSAFVNANALMSYIPLTYLTHPFTITGHCFALRREILAAAGEFDGLDQHIDDDHALAFRVRRLGLQCVQTPMVYDVANDLVSLRAYRAQMKRWFTFPRAALLPFLSPREQIVSALGSLGNLVPPILGILILLRGCRRAAARALAMSLALFAGIYAFTEARYLGQRTPIKCWPLVAVVALVTPVHIAGILFGNSEIEWRGQRLRISRGGKFEVIHTVSKEKSTR